MWAQAVNGILHVLLHDSSCFAALCTVEHFFTASVTTHIIQHSHAGSCAQALFLGHELLPNHISELHQKPLSPTCGRDGLWPFTLLSCGSCRCMLRNRCLRCMPVCTMYLFICCTASPSYVASFSCRTLFKVCDFSICIAYSMVWRRRVSIRALNFTDNSAA